jgi:muramoyltetrapeptide carboxypeptidase
MKTIKPKALKHGDVIGIAAPASPPASEDKLNTGIRYLEQLGYRIKLGKHVLNRRGYLAGSDANRASDLNELFLDKNVKAIFTVRGGYGCQRILPLLDYNLIRKNPKILVGYSDITALHLALFEKIRLITFSGPMVAVEIASGMSGKTEEQFWQSLTSTRPHKSIKNLKSTFVQKTNSTTGKLLGGNLSLVVSLIGTPYFPSLNKSILFLEEIEEQPYRIDRMLQQMKLAGTLNNPSGVVLGEFTNCIPQKNKESLTLTQIFQDTFLAKKYPVVSGFNYGHVKKSLTFPVGVSVQLDAEHGSLEFLEGGVS